MRTKFRIILSKKIKVVNASINIPPDKGTLPLLEKDWCVSPEKFRKKPFFFITSEQITTKDKYI